MREMKDSGIEWIGEIPNDWEIVPVKRFFRNKKQIVGNKVDDYERLALTLNGVIKRSKEDSDGLQPEKFEGYQILNQNELVFKLIDLENVKTSRVGLSPFTGLVSPAYIVLNNNKKDNRFYYYWFISMYYNEIFNSLGGDGVRSSLNAKELLNLPIVSISDKKQKDIANFLDDKCEKIDRMIAKEQEEIEKLKEYKQSIITEAVTRGLNPDVEMKDSGVEWIGKIPLNWYISKFKYISDAIGDGIHATPNYNENGNIYFVNGNNIGNDYLVFKEGTNTIDDEEYSHYKALYLTNNTILITLNGATYGKTSFYNGEKVLLGKSAGYITLKSSTNKEFIRYYLQSYSAKIIMELSLLGSTIANLSLSTLNDFLVPYPPMKEQIEIVNYLNLNVNTIESTILKKNRIIEKLQSYKKSIIYEYTTGKKEVI